MPDILSQEVSGETVLLDLKGECYFGLDEVGTRIWQLIQEHRDLKRIYEIMLEEYNVDGEILQRDLDELVTKLVEAGLANLKET